MSIVELFKSVALSPASSSQILFPLTNRDMAERAVHRQNDQRDIANRGCSTETGYPNIDPKPQHKSIPA
jgi:hypothetical protein